MRSLGRLFLVVMLSLIPGLASISTAAVPQSSNGSPLSQVEVIVPPPTPTDCSSTTDYKRWFFDSQAWWRDKGEGYFDQEHLHLGTCFPHAQTISGVVPFDAVIKLHNNPGAITWVRVQIFLPPNDPKYDEFAKDGCHGDGIVCYDPQPPLSCPATVTDCTFNVHFDVDTTKFPYDGLQEFRIATNMAKGDSLRLYQTNGWRAYLANGNGREVKPVSFDSTMESVEGRGWHTGANYSNARIDSFPQSPVSGIWTFNVRLDKGADGAKVTEHEILIDPDIHAGSKGASVPVTIGGTATTAPVLGRGPYSGSVSIDTTKLEDGVHKLFLRAGATIRRPAGTNSGVLVVPFTVDNVP